MWEGYGQGRLPKEVCVCVCVVLCGTLSSQQHTEETELGAEWGSQMLFRKQNLGQEGLGQVGNPVMKACCLGGGPQSPEDEPWEKYGGREALCGKLLLLRRQKQNGFEVGLGWRGQMGRLGGGNWTANAVSSVSTSHPSLTRWGWAKRRD